MARSLLTQAAILLSIASSLFTTTIHATCNTDQNPYCAGNSLFEQLCCNPGSICYWSNSGAASCCQAGTDCSWDNGPKGNTLNAVTQVQQSTYYSEVVYTSTIPQVVYYTSTANYNSWQPWASTQIVQVTTAVTQPAVVYVTTTVPYSQAVVATDQAYVTVTQNAQPVLVAGATRYSGSRQAVYRAGVTAAVVAGACALLV